MIEFKLLFCGWFSAPFNRLYHSVSRHRSTDLQLQFTKPFLDTIFFFFRFEIDQQPSQPHQLKMPFQVGWISEMCTKPDETPIGIDILIKIRGNSSWQIPVEPMYRYFQLIKLDEKWNENLCQPAAKSTVEKLSHSVATGYSLQF